MQSLRVSFQTRSMGFQLRAIRRKVVELKLPFMRLTPRAVKLGVVVSGIVDNDDHAASALVRTALDQAQESPRPSSHQNGWVRARRGICRPEGAPRRNSPRSYGW